MTQDELQVQLLSAVEKILGPDGLMVCSTNYRFNPQQLAYARQVAYGFCRYREADRAAAVNMLQAATGTGKSLGYLVPAFVYSALTGERVMVSTYTRSLQQQLLDNDAPKASAWVAEALGCQVSFARRVGRQNYLSQAACRDLLANLENEELPNLPAMEFMFKLVEWVSEHGGRAPTIDDYLHETGSDSAGLLPAGIERSTLAISAVSPSHEIEAYQSDVAKTFAADVVIVNHALVMLDASRWAKLLDGEDRKTSVLICDEADRLSDAAESVLSADVSLHRLGQLAAAISINFKIPGINDAVARLNEAAVKTESHDRDMAAMPADLVVKLNQTVDALRPCAEQFSKQLLSQQEELQQTDLRLMTAFCDSFNDLSRVAVASRSESNLSIISWSPVRQFPSLRVGRPEPARIITRLLAPVAWDSDKDELLPPRSYLRAALFTSATLAIAGRSLPAAFDDFSNQVGVIRHCKPGSNLPIHNVTADLFRAFDAPHGFGHMTFVLPDSTAPFPSGDELKDTDGGPTTSVQWLDYCAAMIRKAASMPGKVLVLTTSYADTQSLADRLGDVTGLITARRGDALAVLKSKYVLSERAVLIAPNCWEGIDLPGQVHNLVIARLPFGSLDGFRLSIHEASLRQRGYSEDKITQIKYAMLSQEARKRFSQGLGRGIRRHDDQVRVWIADARFPYPEDFANSLDPLLMAPRTRVASAFADCIPQRFADSFKRSRIFTVDGELCTPEVI